MRCLGLAGGSGEERAVSLYSSIGDIIDDEDIEGPAKPTVSGSSRAGSEAAVKVSSGNQAPAPTSAPLQLSARQRNRLAREARSSAAMLQGAGPTVPRGKRRRRGEVGNGGDDCDEIEREDGPPAFLGIAGGMIDISVGARGALVSLAADLVAQLFHPVWQCRHGAALGALSILRAWNARRRKGECVPYGDRMGAWAEDAVARCVCVLALDQFGDYSSRMVAPVRETAAQLLAVAALQLDGAGLRQTANLLSELTVADEWQPRHGGFCGLESLCAVAIGGENAGRGGVSHELPVFLRSLVDRVSLRGLADPAEDVCAAAARAVGLVLRRFLHSEPLQSSCGEGNLVVRLPGVSQRAGERGKEGKSIFDLVWRALDRLDQYSSCVEDLAGLLETCCEDVSQGPGGADCLFGEDHRLRILTHLWGDGRARVRACAVRSLLALARGIVRAAHEASNLPPALTVAATATATASDGCVSLLRRCFLELLSEENDDVRSHCAQLWSVLLKTLKCSTDDPAAAFAALTTACLGALFAAPTTLDSPTFPVGPGPAAADDAHPSIREARPSKPSRRAGLSAIAKRQQKKEKQHRIRLEEWAGKGAVAPFVARLVAAKALAQLTREADHCVRSNAAPRRASAGEQPRRGTRANDVDRFGRGSETVMATPRESVLTEAAQRAGSAWAWERELAFLLVESCAGQGDERARDRSLPSRSRDSEEREAVRTACAAVDSALRANIEGNISSGKVFRELKGVDAAVSSACSGVIRVLLSQVAPAEEGSGAGRRLTPVPTVVDDDRPDPTRAPPPKGKRKRSKSGMRVEATATAAPAVSKDSRRSSHPPGVAVVESKGDEVKAQEEEKAPDESNDAASVEETFQSLAVAFGETLKPLRRGATRQETEAVWTGRMRHFHALIQAQQTSLARRVAAAAVSAHTVCRPLPSELNPILRPLVAATKKEDDPERRRRSASRLARVAAELLEEASPERRDAGGMVLFGFATTAGGYLGAALAPSDGEGKAFSSTDAAAVGAHAGATETLRFAVSLTSYPAVPSMPVGLSAEGGVNACDNSKRADARYGIGSWVLQTVAPLVRHATANANEKTNNKMSPVPMVFETRPRKLSAVERKMSTSELRVHELLASLGVADALLQASRDPLDRKTGPLAGLMLETPLAAGLLALAKSIPTTEGSDGIEVSGCVTSDGTAVADVALAVARDAAAICPHGIWLGLRAELLPVLLARYSGGDSRGAGSGGREVRGASGRSRAGLVLKEVVEGMGTGVVPFATRLLPVALKGMTDADEEVRGLLAGTFNRLVKAVALVAGEDCDEGLAGSRVTCALVGQGATVAGDESDNEVERDGELIARHLVRGEPLPRLHRGLLPVGLARRVAKGVDLRPYQWEGVAWLNFLRRIGAHGVLADDMGLGKTLQALMAVAMCHHQRPGRRSLVVCPSILVRHWQAECSRYFSDDLLRAVTYEGSAPTRRRLAEQLGLSSKCASRASPSPPPSVAEGRGQRGRWSRRGTASRSHSAAAAAGAAASDTAAAVTMSENSGEMDRVVLERANVVITSYNVLRMDADVLSDQAWLFLVLDEAHILRNPATRTAKAARALRSDHRLGLTGTPIQNSVLELWSLFQFLMPGYLGNRKRFQRDVARPVRAAFSADGDGRAMVEGLKQLEKLHKQVLPFVLRREKSEVLADLPPKIITDILCDLTPEQRRLHELWERGGDGGVLQAVATVEAFEAARLRATNDVADVDATAETTAREGDGLARTTSPPPVPTEVDGASRAGGAATPEMAAVATVSANRERISMGTQALACLSKLQLLCVHPALVAEGARAERTRASRDVRLSGKLMALRELLRDAGICERRTGDTTASDGDLSCDDVGSTSSSEGTSASGGSSEEDDSDREDIGDNDGDGDVDGGKKEGPPSGATEAEIPKQPLGFSSGKTNSVGRSRFPSCKCLIFAQHKAALDVTESALLRPWFRGVIYLRIDGSSSQANRAEVVDRFSKDPAVTILLLTTRVGHLGLNLSAASMVVFLEHDWNPQVDLQAMDRAHRLGQRKAVNVYRLIAADSIEQRVLRLQGHKLGVASAVVNRENSSVFASGTGGVLGMLGTAAGTMAAARNSNEGQSGGVSGVGEGVELWSADEDYAYLAAERLADSVAQD